jgi:hypothetical protein
VDPDPGKGGGTPGERRVAQGDGPSFGDIIFASEQERDGSPANPGAEFPSGETTQLFAYFDYAGMKNGMQFNYAWTLDGAAAHGDAVDWEWDEEGTFYLQLNNRNKPMPDGEYQLVLGVDGTVLQQGTATVGDAGQAHNKPPVEDDGVTVSGTIVDADTGDPIAGAIFVALNPGVTTREFLQEQDKAMVAAFAQTDRDGAYVLQPPLARGEKYSAIIVAEGYRMLAADNVLNIGPDTPGQVEIKPIELSSN